MRSRAPPPHCSRTGPSTCAPATRRRRRARASNARLPTRARHHAREPDAAARRATTGASASRIVAAVVVDEWHELMASKRGVQVELALARLRAQAPRLRVWGLSATLANLDEALRVPRRVRDAHAGRIVEGLSAQGDRDRHGAPADDRALSVGRPHRPQAAAAGGPRDRARALDAGLHQRALGDRDLVPGAARGAPGLGGPDRAASRLARARSARLGRGRPARRTGCAPSSARRASTSASTSRRSSRCCRSAVRRASRACCSAPDAAGISPGAVSKITVVPTQALELVEAAAAREAAAERRIEPRLALQAPLDVLVQHLVTCALGGGFAPDELLARSSRTTHAYAALTDAEWQWALDFVVHGGASLNAYPEYRRVVIGDDGVARVPDRQIARRHRAQIGTIVSRCEHRRAAAQRPPARPRRGIVHRAAVAGRLLRVRRTRARIRPRARDDGVGEARAGEGGDRHALARHEDAAVDAACPSARGA